MVCCCDFEDLTSPVRSSLKRPGLSALFLLWLFMPPGISSHYLCITSWRCPSTPVSVELGRKPLVEDLLDGGRVTSKRHSHFQTLRWNVADSSLNVVGDPFDEVRRVLVLVYIHLSCWRHPGRNLCLTQQCSFLKEPRQTFARITK